ncbi:MAG: hypothetical protein AAGF23_20845, partial [Acidobacteriota bacterium]
MSKDVTADPRTDVAPAAADSAVPALSFEWSPPDGDSIGGPLPGLMQRYLGGVRLETVLSHEQ